MNKSLGELRLQPDLWGRLVEVTVGAYLVNAADCYGKGCRTLRQKLKGSVRSHYYGELENKQMIKG